MEEKCACSERFLEFDFPGESKMRKNEHNPLIIEPIKAYFQGLLKFMVEKAW